MSQGGSVGPYDFGEISRADYSGLPEQQSVLTRDGTSLALRSYEAEAQAAVLMLHGSSAEGRYCHPMARFLSGRCRAAVYVPDLRGHGNSGGRRGDVDYIGQLEDDVEDLLAAIRKRRPGVRLVLLGHSSGGGLAVRFAGGRRAPLVDGYVLLAPFLGATAPTSRPASGGWADVDVPRVIELATRAAKGDITGQDRVVLRFRKPESARTGREVLEYSFRMMVSYAPRQDLASDLSAITRPLLVLVGERDESFIPENYAPTISPHVTGTFQILSGLTHFGVVMSPSAAEAVDRWVAGLGHAD